MAIDEYVQRLVRIGFPQSEAFGICCDLYKRGLLAGFVADQENAYRAQCARYAAEVIG